MRRPSGSMLRNGLIVSVVGAALAFAGCGGGGGSSSSGSGGDAAVKKGGTLRVGMNGEVVSLNPTAPENIGTAEIFVTDQIMETLYRSNSKGEVFPWLAQSGKPSADGLTWTIELKPDVVFSDGEPMTSADVVFSLEEARKCVNYSFVYEPIESIEATSPTTVTIKLSKPVPAMEANLSLYAAAIVPKGFGGASAKAFGQHPIGTGPYMLTQWEHGKSLTLDRNPKYRNPQEPNLDQLVFYGILDDNSRISQLRAGDIDMAFAPEFPQLKGLESTPGLKLSEIALNRADYIGFNVKSPLFSDPRVREAANLAIDREGIVQAALGGYGEVGAAWLPPTLKFADTEIEPVKRDVAKAKQLLAEAVKDGGLDPKFNLKFPTDAYSRITSQVIQEDLNEVGFDVTLEPVDPAVVLEQVATEEYGAYLIALISDVPDPSELVGLYVGGLEGLFTFPKNLAELGKVAAKAEVEQDETKRAALYDQIAEMVGEEENLPTLDYQPQVFAMDEDVVGYHAVSAGAPWFAEVGFAE